MNVWSRKFCKSDGILGSALARYGYSSITTSWRSFASSAMRVKASAKLEKLGDTALFPGAAAWMAADSASRFCAADICSDAKNTVGLSLQNSAIRVVFPPGAGRTLPPSPSGRRYVFSPALQVPSVFLQKSAGTSLFVQCIIIQYIMIH